MSKHTPGPWHAELPANGAIHISAVAAGSTDICDLYHVGHPVTAGASGEVLTKDNAEANARLIAAAPDLLDVVVRLTNKIAAMKSGTRSEKMGRAAIAKATGVDR